MSYLGDAFASRIGKPDVAVPRGVEFPGPADRLVWNEIHEEIGSGWYLNRFLYLFGEGLETLQPCLDAWAFLVEPGPERMIIGRNAYGALLVAEDPGKHGFVCPVRLLDPLNVLYWGDPNLAFTNLLGHWLPQEKLPDFLDHALYDAWVKVTGDYLDLDEALAIIEPKPLGGTMVAENFQIENIVEYYQTTGPIYAEALKGKR